jgi:hypothetical protein
MFFLAVACWIYAQAGQLAPRDSTPEDAAGPASRTPGLTVQVTVTPETVTVGDHFTVSVHVRVPANLAAGLEFPYGPDSSQSDVTDISSLHRHDTHQGKFVDATATYVLSAWRTGQVGASLGNLVIGKKNVVIPDDSIVVRSVLPEDSMARAEAKPKSPRSLLEKPFILRILRPLQEHLLVGVSLLLLLLAAVLVWWRARRRAAVQISGNWVESEFQRIEAMHLLERGESEQYTILMTMVVRQYLIRTFATVRVSATTRELSAALHGESLIPEDRVLALFERVDLLKFAHARIPVSEAQATGTECRSIVSDILNRRQAAAIALEQQHQTNSAKRKPVTGRKRAA